jgi:putative oxidoreductase
MISRLTALYHQIFDCVESWLEGWFLGLFARFTFAAVLYVYFFNSGLTKIGEGLFGFLSVTDNAYFQILPSVVEAYSFDASQVPFIPYGLIVYLGTYSEFILPALIVVGLLTRVAALGMIGFVVVQSIVDIAFHGADAKTIGALFDRFSDAVILDQRALWIFLLVYLVVRGAGSFSLDYLLTRKAASANAAN